MSDLIYEQEKEIIELRNNSNNLQQQIDKSNEILSDLVPGFFQAIGKQSNLELNDLEEDKTENYSGNIAEEFHISGNPNDIVYFDISDAQIENIIEIARDTYLQRQNGNDAKYKLLLGEDYSLNDKLQDVNYIKIEDHLFWQKIDTDPAYKKEIIKFIKNEMDKIVHTHKKYANIFTEIKVRKN